MTECPTHSSAPPEAAPDRISASATRLFAALGYDGASTRLIADAAGVNISTLAYYAGTKRDLYLAVMERAQRTEREVLEAAIAQMRAGGGVGALIDAYLDFTVAHPEFAALWMHRWLSDAADVAHLERLHVLPMLREVAAAVTEELGPRAAEIDIEYLVWTVVWATHGFVRGGLPDADGERMSPPPPSSVERMRATLHSLIGTRISAADPAGA
ncbi:TetR/AcrR family transcriptional regulator [Nocardiopsis coralliicola]